MRLFGHGTVLRELRPLQRAARHATAHGGLPDVAGAVSASGPAANAAFPRRTNGVRGTRQFMQRCSLDR